MASGHQGESGPLALLIQPACLQHKYIRHANSSHIFERPERLRAVLLGFAAALARLEADDASKVPMSPAASADGGDDDLSNMLSSLSIRPSVSAFLPPSHLILPPPPSPPSTPGQVLLHNPALQLAHAPPEEAPFPFIPKSRGAAFPNSTYLRDLFKWASEAVEAIRTTGCEIPPDKGLNPGDLYLGPGTILAIEGAVQTVCQAVDGVCAASTHGQPTTPPASVPTSPSASQQSPTTQSFSAAFCAIRPPGHHCGEDEPSGFCYVNNVVVGAMHAYIQHDVDRAIIIDFDLHHGNGTQALVMPLNAASYAEDLAMAAGKPPSDMRGLKGPRRGWKGFYGSVHDIYSYPCEDGDLDLVKDASLSLAAHGQYIENIHLQPYANEADFYDRIYPKYLALLDKARVFMDETKADPERTVVFISAGFDACEHEHQGMQRHDRRVPVSFYSRYTKDIMAFADAHAQGKVVSVLEGGYGDRALTSAAMGHAIGMLGRDGVADWWKLEELLMLERAVKKRRKGKLCALPPDLSSISHIARTHALLSHFEGGAPPETPAPSVNATPQQRMTLRERRPRQVPLDDSPAPRRRGKTPASTSTTPVATPRRPHVTDNLASKMKQEVGLEVEQASERKAATVQSTLSDEKQGQSPAMIVDDSNINGTFALNAAMAGVALASPPKTTGLQTVDKSSASSIDEPKIMLRIPRVTPSVSSRDVSQSQSPEAPAPVSPTKSPESTVFRPVDPQAAVPAPYNGPVLDSAQPTTGSALPASSTKQGVFDSALRSPSSASPVPSPSSTTTKHKVIGLISGGKDSIFSLMHAVANGHEIVALATLTPPPGIDELDSHMYQSVATTLPPLIAKAMGLPHYSRVITGSGVEKTLEYGSRQLSGAGAGVKGDETEDMAVLLQEVIASHPEATALSSGAILSNYQRLRVEHVCGRLRLTSLAYLWQSEQLPLVISMISSGLEAVLVKVSGSGLNEQHLGKSLSQMFPVLSRLELQNGTHPAGEGGEFETFTLNSPLFSHRIVLGRSEVAVTDASPMSTVAYLRIHEARLEAKDGWVRPTSQELRGLLGLEDHDPRGLDEAAVKVLDACNMDIVPPHTSLAYNKPRESIPDALRYGHKGRWFALSAEGSRLGTESIGEELTRCLDSITQCLNRHGPSLLSTAYVTLMLADMSLFPAANEAYMRYFGASPPARACVAVPMDESNQRVCVEVVGLDDEPMPTVHALGSQRVGDRSALHVQGLSYWAPANIGPYSQAVTVNSRVHIAGQIPLLPSSLTIPAPPPVPASPYPAQAALALKHVGKIVEVLRSPNSTGGNWRGWGESVVGWWAYPIDLSSGGEGSDVARRAWIAWARENGWTGAPAIFVRASALPRGALVEYQVNMHTGRAGYATLADDDQDYFEEPFAKYSHGKATRAYWETCIAPPNRQGARAAIFLQEASGGTELASSSDISAVLEHAVTIRVYHLPSVTPSQILLLRHAVARGACYTSIPTHEICNVHGEAFAIGLELFGA